MPSSSYWLCNDCIDLREVFTELLRLSRVSIEGRGPSSARCAYPFPPSTFCFFLDCHFRTKAMIPRDVAFLILRQAEMESSDVLTLYQSINRCTGELFSSLSRMVRRQSSIASLTAVMNRMNMRGTELRPGFAAPKIGNISTEVSLVLHGPRDYGAGILTVRMMRNKK